MRIGPARDVAGRIDSGNAGFEKLIHRHAAIDRKAGLFGQRQARPHADADDDEIGLQHAAALQRRALAVDRGHGVAEMKDDAVLLMQGADEIAHLRPQHALHRPRLRRHDMDLDLARAQRRRDLKADETGADHDGAARAVGGCDDRAAIGQRAQAYGHAAGRRPGSAAAPARRRSPAAGDRRRRLPPAVVTLRALVSIERHCSRAADRCRHRRRNSSGRSGSQSSGALPAR